MARYSVSGTLTPDATTADTGEPVGVWNGQPYWRWLVGEQEWYLWKYLTVWVITKALQNLMNNAWQNLSGDIPGTYSPITGASGTATVAEYVEPPPATEYAVLTINDGLFAGQYIVLKTR